ncbi:hypothetical protein KC364_g65 [Hortaea werneckii]|nr:hypothetical protein KC364_g65 [Hortaea werneckii]
MRPSSSPPCPTCCTSRAETVERFQSACGSVSFARFFWGFCWKSQGSVTKEGNGSAGAPEVLRGPSNSPSQRGSTGMLSPFSLFKMIADSTSSLQGVAHVLLRLLFRFTFGIMTSFRALGASLRPRLASPCGWYWYLASLPVFQGSESGAWATRFSDEDEVGLRLKCQPARVKAPVMIARRIWWALQP